MTTPLTEADLAAARERLEQAALPPLVVAEYYENTVADHLAAYQRRLEQGTMDGPDRAWPAVTEVHSADGELTVAIVGNGPNSRSIGRLFAHAPTDIRALLADNRRLRAALTQIEQRHPAQADVAEHQDGFSYHYRFCEECDGSWLPDKDEEHEHSCATGIARRALAGEGAGDE